MINIIVIADISGSMRASVFSGGKPKIELLKEKLASILTELEHKVEVHIYGFHDNLISYGSTKNLSKANEIINNLTVDVNRCTKLWDSICEVINTVDINRKTLILCITDGVDTGSLIRPEYISSKVKSNVNLDLKIIDITGELSKDKKLQEITEEEERFDIDEIKISDLEGEIKKSIQKTVKHATISLNISIPVIPLTLCSESDLQTINISMNRVVPYLEELTGLRYYPVTTYIVNEKQMQKLLPEEKVPLIREHNELERDIYEILRFMDSVLQAFHILHFSDSYNYKIEREVFGRDNYRDYARTKLSDDACEKLRLEAESIVGKLEKLMNNTLGKIETIIPALREKLNLSQPNPYTIPGLVATYNYMIFSEIALKEIYLILKNIYNKHPDYFMEEEHFSQRNRGLKAELDCWERRVNKKDFEELSKCVNEKHEWKLELKYVSKVFYVAIKVIFDLIRLYRSLKYSRIIEKLRAYGLYLPQNYIYPEKFAKILQKVLPGYFKQNESSGKVLICLEEIRKCTYENMNGETTDVLKTLYENLITTNLIHEHAHAVIYEGLSKEYRQIDRGVDGDDIVHEGLAEWAEINFFRDNIQMTDIIIGHAASGKLPDWPYASALIIERKYELSSGFKGYRSLLNTLRTDPEKAIKRLLK